MAKARWWQQQYRGFVGFFAGFLGVSCTIFRQMNVVSNLGARKIVGFDRRFNSHDVLTGIRSEFSIDVQQFFLETVVRWVGRCFRHPSHPVSLLMSLPLEGRLNELRSRGTETPLSWSAFSFWTNLCEAGLDVDFPVSGRPAIRGSSGAAIRWGEGWLGPIRDGGVGWIFERDARPEIELRVGILQRLFKRARAPSNLALGDGPLAISA